MASVASLMIKKDPVRRKRFWQPFGCLIGQMGGETRRHVKKGFFPVSFRRRKTEKDLSAEKCMASIEEKN